MIVPQLALACQDCGCPLALRMWGVLSCRRCGVQRPIDVRALLRAKRAVARRRIVEARP